MRLLLLRSNLCGCLSNSFILYNSFLLFTIIWSLHQRESEEAPFMALCINLLSIMFDIVNMSLNWPVVQTGSMQFGAAMAVLNLLLRPVSSYLLYRIVQDRAGSYGSFGLPSGFDSLFGGRRSPYEDIDQPPQQAQPTGIETQNPTTPGSPPENLFST